MLYIKRVIDMLRSVLHDISFKICTGCPDVKTVKVDDLFGEDKVEVFLRIANTLDSLEADFRLFLEFLKENNIDE